MDSCFLPAFVGMTGNDGLKETIPLSFVRNRDHESPWIPASAGMTDSLGTCAGMTDFPGARSWFDRGNNGSSDSCNNRGPDYARCSACEPRSAEAWAPSPRKPVIPRHSREACARESG